MLHLHHCIYFADLGIFFLKKKMLFFVLFLVTLHIKSSVTLCQKKVQCQIWKYTDFFKTFNRSLELIRYQQHQNRPKFTFAVQYWIEQQEAVHTE